MILTLKNVFGKEINMFHKKGTPQPIHVASGKCEICGSQPATTMCEGKMVCSSCKENINKK